MLRDRKCAWPRRGRPAGYCDVHHTRHKKDNSKTSVANGYHRERTRVPSRRDFGLLPRLVRAADSGVLPAMRIGSQTLAPLRHRRGRNLRPAHRGGGPPVPAGQQAHRRRDRRPCHLAVPGARGDARRGRGLTAGDAPGHYAGGWPLPGSFPRRLCALSCTHEAVAKTGMLRPMSSAGPVTTL